MVKSYDRTEAVRYAREWALGKNPDFYFFGGIGGDCTNFVSQCLLAGGGVMNYDKIKGWYYNSSFDRSASWTSVAYFMKYLLRKEDSKGPKGEIISLSEVEVGDILFLRQNPTHFNHSLIITRKVGGRVFVCAHTNSALDKPLNEYFYNEILPIHIININA